MSKPVPVRRLDICGRPRERKRNLEEVLAA